MAQSRSRVNRLLVVLAMVGAATYSTGVTVAPAGADVTAVRGSAYSYQTNVSLFNGPSTTRGFGQVQCTTDSPPAPAGCVPSPQLAQNPLAASESPSVILPTTGGDVSDSDPDGAAARYGPAAIFAGKWPDVAPSAPPSGPLSVACNGRTGAGGQVTCNTTATLFSPAPAAAPGGVGPGPVVADEVRSTCSATETNASTGARTLTGSSTFVNGVLETKYDASTQRPTQTEPIPANPPVNHTRTGTIDHVGDSYSVVFNEHVNNADGSLTVNAVHMTLLGPTARGDLIIGSVTCGLTTAQGATTTTQAGNTTTTQAGATTTTQAGATTTTSAGGTTTTSAGATTTTSAGATTTTAAGATTTTAAGATTTTAAGGATTTTAAGGNTTTTSAGAGGSVSGGACGYFTSVGLFGGPPMLRGCDQPAGALPTNASPSVTLPAAGSATPITATDEDGATAEYGPAKIFSGQYPSDPNAPAPPSGPISVSTQGVPGGTVTSSAEIALPRGVGPGPIIADGVRSTCTASASGVSGTTTITNGKVEKKYDAASQDPIPGEVEAIPTNPPVGFSRSGTIDHVGDRFEVVYNEQIVEGDSIVVNAVHLRLLGPTAVGEMVIGQSRCGLTAGGSGGGGAGGGGTGGGGTGGSGGVARTGTNALRLVTFAMLLVAAGLLVRRWAPQLEWYETTPTGGRRRQFPRRAGKPRRPPMRPWD